MSGPRAASPFTAVPQEAAAAAAPQEAAAPPRASLDAGSGDGGDGTPSLPPRPSLSRSGSLARATSLVLLQPVRPRTAVYGFGRNDVGQLGLPPQQGAARCPGCGAGCGAGGAPAGPPGVVAAPAAIGALSGRAIVGAACSLFNSALLTADGELLMLGSNDSGLLGRPRRAPGAVAVDGEQQGQQEEDCSWLPARVEALQGLLAAWGDNDSAQLGLGASGERPQHTPKLLRAAGAAKPGPSHDGAAMRAVFVRVAAGAGCSAAISSSGRVYTWGQGDHGVLGLGLDGAACMAPRELASLWQVAVTQLAVGESHVVALEGAGRVFSWGRGKYGALGHGGFDDEHTPRQVRAVRGVAAVAAGDHHTLLLAAAPADAGAGAGTQVLACGRGTFGATGLGDTGGHVCRPSEVQALAGQRIAQLAAGRQHSVALTAGGALWTWGGGELGQLGLGCSCRGGVPGGDGGAGAPGTWLLPTAQPSPRRLARVPWPASCPVLYIAAGGDHTLLCVQLAPAGGGEQPGTTASQGSLQAISEGHAAPTATAAPAAQPVDPHAASPTAAAAAAVAAAELVAAGTAAAPASGPQPDGVWGATLVPLPPPPLLLLARAAAAEAAAEQAATSAGGASGAAAAAADADAAAAADAAANGGGAAAVAAAASAAVAAQDAHAAARSSAGPPSPLVVDLVHAVLDVFGSAGWLLQLFKAVPAQAGSQPGTAGAPEPDAQQQPRHGLNLSAIEATFSLLLRSYRREVVCALGTATLRLLGELPASEAWASGRSVDVVRLIFIMLQCPLNSDTAGLGANLVGALTALTLRLNRSSLGLLMSWLGELQAPVFGGRVVRPVQALITRLAREASAAAAALQQQAPLPPGARRPPPGLGKHREDVLLLARLMDVLHHANIQAGELIPWQQFANAALSSLLNCHEEYLCWLQHGAYKQQYEAYLAATARATSADQPPPQQQQHSPGQPSPQSRSPRARGGGRESPSSGARSPHASEQQQPTQPGGAINSLCQVPFLLSTSAKQRILRDESLLQQQHVVNASAMAALAAGLPPGGIQQQQQQQLAQQQQQAQAQAQAQAQQRGSRSGGWAPPPHDSLSLMLSLHVRRGHVLHDSLQQIRSCSQQDLKKPLRVTFLSEDGSIAEEGLDQGGVSRELFLLLVDELLSPDFGMFTAEDEAGCRWFNAGSLEALDEFELVGTVVGLACFNGLIIDAKLPRPVYKKLLGQAPEFADLALLWPSLHRGLQQLLDFEGDVEATFCRMFEVEVAALGVTRRVELVPGGASLPVTAANRRQFVDAYTHWLLSASITDQFTAFATGFHRVCGGLALSLFRYEELELLIEGLPHLDFNALQEGAAYEGYTRDSTTVQALWRVLRGLSLDEKRAFLQFTTGCDRAPVAGLGALRLLVQRAGPDSDRLPTAYTCFYALLLPDYRCADKLRAKLMAAIQNAQGFGMQ